MKTQISRSAVCKEAARQWRNSQRLGLGKTWADCMKRAWAIAKQRQREIEQFHSVKREASRHAQLYRMVQSWPAAAKYKSHYVAHAY